MKYGPSFAQGSPKWAEWRLDGIGASDAAAIAGLSASYLTMTALWKLKTRELPESALTNPFMAEWRERGNALEPAARAAYELHVGDWVEPCLVVHPEHDWLRASLDGLSSDEMVPLEIKCPGKTKHATALAGKMPSEYYPQCQHALMVTGLPLLHYWSFDGEAGALVKVKADPEYQAKLFQRERFFWECVQSGIPPDVSVCLQASLKKPRR